MACRWGSAPIFFASPVQFCMARLAALQGNFYDQWLPVSKILECISSASMQRYGHQAINQNPNAIPSKLAHQNMGKPCGHCWLPSVLLPPLATFLQQLHETSGFNIVPQWYRQSNGYLGCICGCMSRYLEASQVIRRWKPYRRCYQMGIRTQESRADASG